MELRGVKIKLRPVDSSDVDDLYNWWNDADFNGDYAGFDPKSGTEIEEMAKDPRFFIISSRSEGKKAGFISYYRVRKDYENLFEIGYRLRSSERRKGYTTEAARLLVDYLFTTKSEIERIKSVVDTENIPSQRVLEKNGFKRVAELKRRFFNKGQYRDEYMYRLLREEWQEAKAR